MFSCIPDEKKQEIQGFGQGQKYCSDPDVYNPVVLTLCLTLVVMDVS